MFNVYGRSINDPAICSCNMFNNNDETLLEGIVSQPQSRGRLDPDRPPPPYPPGKKRFCLERSGQLRVNFVVFLGKF